jgi:hypothetical protein
MGKVIYSMGVSLDGFIAGPRGEIAVVPDEELPRASEREQLPACAQATAAAVTTRITAAGSGATPVRRPIPSIVPAEA